jgi:hypothetical protein
LVLVDNAGVIYWSLLRMGGSWSEEPPYQGQKRKKKGVLERNEYKNEYQKSDKTKTPKKGIRTGL